MSNKALVPESKNGLSKFKTEVAQELEYHLKTTMEIYQQDNVVPLEEKW